MLVEKLGGAKVEVAADVTDSEGAKDCGCICCCVGEDSGDPLDKEERSDEPDVRDRRYIKLVSIFATCKLIQTVER